jgi:hypothetical protein
MKTFNFSQSEYPQVFYFDAEKNQLFTEYSLQNQHIFGDLNPTHKILWDGSVEDEVFDTVIKELETA